MTTPTTTTASSPVVFLVIFDKGSNLPKLMNSSAKKTLFIASFLGSNGQRAYNELFESGLNEKIRNGVRNWKMSKVDSQLNDGIPYYHGKMKSDEMEWREMISYLNKIQSIDQSFIAEQVPIMKEIANELKNNESKSKLAEIYLSLFQPNFEQIILKNLNTEKNDVKRKIFAIREKGKYDNLKPDTKLLVQIFEFIQ